MTGVTESQIGYVGFPRYSQQASLNPNETSEFPADMETVGGKCLIFDSYGQHTTATVKRFGLPAVIGVFRSEMQYARESGTDKLIQRLQAAGHYPYSDLERQPVA